ncbi:MAG: AI-2E family transporter [Acidimicrobiales bacterium]
MTEPISDAERTPDAGPRIRVEIDATSAFRMLVVALGAAVVFAITQLAPSILTKVFVGIVLALALDPVVNRVYTRFSWNRGTAVALVGTLLGLTFFGVLVLLGPRAIEEAGNLRGDLPATIEDAYSWPIIGERLERADLAQSIDDTIDDLPANLDNRTITRYAEDLLGGLLTTVVVLVTAVAVMLDGETLVRRFRNAVRPEHHARIDGIGRVVYRTFGNYFAGSLFVAILNGMVVLTLGIFLGVPLAPLAGVWSTLTNLIPQIGGFLGGSFFVLLALTEGPLTAAIAAGAFLLYQNLENNVIQPAVIGKAVDLTPPTTMLAALIGGAVAGVPGALVATPIVGVAKVLYLRDATAGEMPDDDPASNRPGDD